MKDIYSPLEIDEEWDQRAPQMGGPDAPAANVAVADAGSETTNASLPVAEAADRPMDAADTAQGAEISAATTAPDMGAEHVDVMGDADQTPTTAEQADQSAMPMPESDTTSTTVTPAAEEENASSMAQAPGSIIKPEIKPERGNVDNAAEAGATSPDDNSDSSETGSDDVENAATVTPDAEAVASEAAADAVEDADTGDLQVSPVDHADVAGDDHHVAEVAPISDEEHEARGARLEGMTDTLGEVDHELEALLEKLQTKDDELAQRLEAAQAKVKEGTEESKAVAAEQAKLDKKRAALEEARNAGAEEGKEDKAA